MRASPPMDLPVMPLPQAHAPVGSRSATAEFDAIYEQHFDHVWNLLRRLGVPQKDLEDACHDTFVAVYRHLAAYDRARPIKPWLCGFAVRVAANHRRLAPVRHEVLPERMPDPQDPRTGSEDDSANRQLVEAALSTLDHGRRTTLVLHDVQGHSVREMSELLQEPEGTLNSRLRTARMQFADAVKNLLRGRGVP